MFCARGYNHFCIYMFIYILNSRNYICVFPVMCFKYFQNILRIQSFGNTFFIIMLGQLVDDDCDCLSSGLYRKAATDPYQLQPEPSASSAAPVTRTIPPAASSSAPVTPTTPPAASSEAPVTPTTPPTVYNPNEESQQPQ